MARTESRARKLAIMLQGSGEGTPATAPSSTDLVQARDVVLNAGQQRLERSDFGAGRSKYGLVAGGNIEADGRFDSHLLLPASFALPQHDLVYLSAFGVSAAVSIETTTTGTPTKSVLELTSATGLQAGDVIFVDVGTAKLEGRPIASVTGDTVTLAIELSAAPTTGATVQSKIYRLANTKNFLTFFDFLTNTKRQAEDVLVNELTFTFEDIINFTANLLASDVVASTETEPEAPTFPDLAFARNFGNVWLDVAAETAANFAMVNAYGLTLRLNNGGERNPSAIGSQKADGSVFGTRTVTLDISLPVGTSDGDNTQYFDDAVDGTIQRFFMQGSRSASLLTGENVAFSCPKVQLVRPDGDVDTSNPNAVYNFNNCAAFATAADDELVVAFG